MHPLHPGALRAFATLLTITNGSSVNAITFIVNRNLDPCTGSCGAIV